MPRQEHILSVFVSSPANVSAERACLEEVVTELNQLWSHTLCVRLELLKWETHSYPGFGSDPQDVINQQIPTDYDIYLGILWHRFGTQTPRAGSGTEEEFKQAKARWDADHTSVNLMFYFKDAPVSPSEIDPTQLAKVAEFRKSLGAQGGLYGTFQTTDDFVNVVRIHLTRVVQEWQQRLSKPATELPVPPPPAAPTSPAPDSPSEEAGLLELSEEFEEKFAEAGDIMTRIAKATQTMASKIEVHANQAQNTAGTTSNAAKKRIITKAAKDMAAYAGKLNQDIPVLRELLETGLGCFSKAIALWPDFASEDSTQERPEEWITAIRGLRETLRTVEGQTQGFLNSVRKLPRVTSELNKAKRSVSTELQSLIDLFQSQQQLLALTEESVASMASSLAKPPAEQGKGTPVAGRGKGMLIVNSEDDEHLKDFAEYQP